MTKSKSRRTISVKVHPPWAWDGFIHLMIGILSAGFFLANYLLFGWTWQTLLIVIAIYGILTLLTLERRQEGKGLSDY